MNKRLEKLFNGKTLAAFITCGDPDMETTEKLALALADAGVGLIELGVPFSDPTAEDALTVSAYERALASGLNTDDVFKLAQSLREKTDVALAFATYANVVYSRGTEAFTRRMADCGVDALILADVPLEEREEFAQPCRTVGIDFISFVTPTSSSRVEDIAKEAEGFVYCVSTLGANDTEKACAILGDTVKRIKAVKDVPCLVGFGVNDPEQARKVAEISDGVIVSDEIIRIVSEKGKDSVPFVKAYAEKIKKAM
ncbi:MAG: tryptophan synthase subunit alpha [Clostridia bacterium]|nr:tryptophan synthase subunit alpha [Clostridia bacterium]